jgi:sulfur-oxidizing protein SoxY
MVNTRRTIFKCLLGLLAASLWPAGVLARSRPAAAEAGERFEQALARALGGKNWTETDRITLEVPELAENGAIVPVTVASGLPNTTQILIFGEKNPGPLLARFRFEPGADGFVSLRIKLNATGHVLALAESGGTFYGTRRFVKVMIGGCG